MLEIFVAKSSGFCFGVKRAINMAEQCGATTDGEICTIGPLIHNPQVVKNLEDAGIRAKSEISEIRSGTVIIRSHGIRRDEYGGLKEKGLNIVDATCPFVKKAQDLVSMLAEEGYSVIVAGEREHPEVKGLISYGRGDITVAESPEELKGMARKKKIGIIAQTTLPVEKLQAIVDFCLTRASEIKVFNTICNATSVRQEESAELARKVDLMIVVGGRNSANTRRLADICRELQPRTHLVEVAAEIDPAWLNGARSVGVTSGASTPEWIIREVVERIAESSIK